MKKFAQLLRRLFFRTHSHANSSPFTLHGTQQTSTQQTTPNNPPDQQILIDMVDTLLERGLCDKDERNIVIRNTYIHQSDPIRELLLLVAHPEKIITFLEQDFSIATYDQGTTSQPSTLLMSL